MLTLKNAYGGETVVAWGWPCWCKLSNSRVRVNKVEPDGMVEVLANDGRTVLPDLRHPSQLVALT